MSFDNLEGLALVLIFVIPGFTAYYTSQFNPRIAVRARYKDFGVFDKTLISIFNSTIIIVIGAIVFWVVLSSARYQFSHNLSQLSNMGFLAFLATDPTLYFFLILFWVTLSLILGFAFGALDPINKILGKRLHRSTTRATDVWYNILEERRKELPLASPPWARVQLESEDILEGYVVDFSLEERDDGSRDMALQLSNLTPKGSESISLSDHTMLALLNTAQTKSIIISYQPKDALSEQETSEMIQTNQSTTSLQ